MDGTSYHNVNWKKPDSRRQVSLGSQEDAAGKNNYYTSLDSPHESRRKNFTKLNSDLHTCARPYASSTCSNNCFYIHIQVFWSSHPYYLPSYLLCLSIHVFPLKNPLSPFTAASMYTVQCRVIYWSIDSLLRWRLRGHSLPSLNSHNLSTAP